MIKTLIVIALQITILFLAALDYFSIEVFITSLALGILYSMYSLGKSKKKGLLIGHLLIIGIFVFWVIVPPYLFSN